MLAANYLLTEEQLLCCICLDVFTDPVTLPCGHNFCKSCITQHLNFNYHRQCPMCKERVDKKYRLGVNTFISEMAVQFRQSVRKKGSSSSSSEQHDAKPLSYDVPIRPKRTALMSCLLSVFGLTCLTVFFVTSLKLHQTVSSLKTHQLFGSVEQAADGTCNEHHKPLELYCRNEHMPICRSCADSSHRFHYIVSLEEENEVKRTELRKTAAQLQQMIQERQLKIQEVIHSIKLSSEAADRETAGGVQVFTTLIQALDRARAELNGMIEKKRKATEKKARGFIRELEQEISGLRRRHAELDQLSHSEDHLHFLRSFSTLKAAPPAKDWTEISICPAVYGGLMRTAMVRAVNQLTETVKNEIQRLQDAELESVQQNVVDVTLDPDSAHPALVLSDDGKQVHCGDGWKKLPENSQRFEPALHVLGKQSFSCGRFHYDVQVKGKTGWTLGVAKQSVSRKGEMTLSPESGYWTICLRNRGGYFALASYPVPLSVNHHPEKRLLLH
ncbi:E3 ubiquitin-protein ligase TRIM7-like isoform X2 [Toxotes jaculatrix]|uniref:E3 ubiquitin-protein ligase TRIM7-like isoform X2 n=1 Tax=Toxotes jaculatrix TaxID=941984 RepID=UPI001B3AC506|nr:E3 ubiquitin-protein ligase TRIM7-like isoform X2 [Toxotes jaculatrix]